MSPLPIILLMWLATYPARLLGLSLGSLRLPPFWLAFLRFVPVSVFAALIVPDVLGSPEWPRRLPAALVGNVFLPGASSAHTVRLDATGALVVRAAYADGTAADFSAARNAIAAGLRRAYGIAFAGGTG